ncbi:amidohydrolase [Vibrio methylphosphonaticus]|uniref:amidohydrolase n=1 Tax=Vibrio methylphosphonaticus TaxID=2946866 RepID=UPI002029FDCD|nr:amidohydrolase [Vibrio methylphosphonaticus]MCL9774007.1 amidohydrolase [Vibrio methylphosphonaticus]
MYSHFKLSLVASSMALIMGCSPSPSPSPSDVEKPVTDLASDGPVTLFATGELITMSEHTLEGANAVVVQDGKIVEVGHKVTLKAKYSELEGFSINRDYADKVVTPGFVEPHIHLWMSAMFLGMDFITPADWNFPWEERKGVIGSEGYKARLNQLHAEKPEGEPIITWGYHHYFHGSDMSREVLNNISKERPILVWHRSAHEFFVNDAAMEMLGWNQSDWQVEGPASEQLNWERGHAFENGMKMLAPSVMQYLIESGRFATGMERTRDYVHSGGITTAVDPGVIATPALYQQMVNILLDDNFPMDYWLIPAGNVSYAMAGYDSEKGKLMAEAQTEIMAGEAQIQWLPKFVKLFSDGAMYSQLMMMKDGYIDGHEGEWLQTPEQLEDSMRPYWEDDYTIIVHANGDLGFETAIEIVEKMQKEKSRDDHRMGFHHLGMTDKDDIPRAVELGANFSVNPYYTHILSELYSEEGLGEERASVMSRGRSFIDAGGHLSLHSDAPMAPAQPLSLVWAAVNRIGLSGDTVMGPEERITVDEAMKAITIDAAYTARLEDNIGSIEPGKYADFTVLEANPYKVAPETINQIDVHATVYRGVPAEISVGNAGIKSSKRNLLVLNQLNQYEGHSHQGRNSFGHNHAHGTDICESSLYFQRVLADAWQR